jgi:hypothetical protein
MFFICKLITNFKISQISNAECISPILSVLNQLVKFHNIFNHHGGEISTFDELFAESAN